MMRRLSLVTVCEEARCPNIHECWARERTATFMLMGDICTRHCGFCAVGKGRPGSLDPEEPERVAEAAGELGLSHAVVTSVNRDDLPDGGAAHFAATIRAIRRRVPGCTIEVLIPDFQGDGDALERVLDEAPEILNHNMETVERLYRRVRPDAGYAQSLALISRAAARRTRDGLALRTKSGLMVGLGETEDEVLRAAARPARRGLRHRHDRTVPATARAAPADRALLHTGGIRAAAARGRGDGLLRAWNRARSSAPRTTPAAPSKGRRRKDLHAPAPPHAPRLRPRRPRRRRGHGTGSRRRPDEEGRPRLSRGPVQDRAPGQRAAGRTHRREGPDRRPARRRDEQQRLRQAGDRRGRAVASSSRPRRTASRSRSSPTSASASASRATSGARSRCPSSATSPSRPPTRRERRPRPKASRSSAARTRPCARRCSSTCRPWARRAR